MNGGAKWQITMPEKEGGESEGWREGTSCLAAVAPAEGHELPSACLLQGNEEGRGVAATCASHPHTHTHTQA